MDPITQGALGGAFAHCVIGHKDPKRAWLVGMIAGMAPDLDILIRSQSDPLLSIYFHRHFTHSLAFIPIGALIVALFFAILPKFRPNWRWVYVAALAGIATHGILDAFTSYGTLLYWPFSYVRVKWDLLSIIDPWVTIPLILGLIWSLVFKNRQGVGVGLLLVVLLICFNGFQHQRALTALNQYGKDHRWKVDKARAIPSVASSTYWRGIVIHDKALTLTVVHTPILSRAKVNDVRSLPIFNKTMLPDWVTSSVTLNKDFDIYQWFTDGYLVRLRSNPLVLVDGRYIIIEQPPVALWGIVFNQGTPHVTKIRLVPVNSAMIAD